MTEKTTYSGSCHCGNVRFRCLEGVDLATLTLTQVDGKSL